MPSGSTNIPSNSSTNTGSVTSSVSSSNSQSSSCSSSCSCDWVEKKPTPWRFLHPTSNLLLFEVTLTYEEWTCKPVKYRKIVWAVTKRADEADAEWLGYEGMPKFKIGSLLLNDTNTDDVPAVPANLPGVKIEWFTHIGANYTNPSKVSYDGEVDSFSIDLTADIFVKPVSNATPWPLSFTPPKPK